MSEEYQIMMFVCEMEQVCHRVGSFNYRVPEKEGEGCRIRGPELRFQKKKVSCPRRKSC
jgi:hypothetical protein